VGSARHRVGVEAAAVRARLLGVLPRISASVCAK
jgi:hypothetical protein